MTKTMRNALAIISLVVIVCGLMAVCVGCNERAVIVAEAEISGEDIYASIPSKVRGVGVSHVLRAVTENGVTYPSIEITATITPADAKNKNVTWTVAWDSESKLKDNSVTDYVTVTADSTNSLKATVVCKKAFRGSTIVVTVTTEEGGYAASCNVTYEGKPSVIDVNSGNALKVNLVGANSYAVSLNNVFDDLGEQYYDEVTVKSYTWGGTYYGGKYNTMNGGSWEELRTNNIADLQNIEMYIDVTYDNQTLTVNNKKSIVESAYQDMTGSSQGALYYGYVKSDVKMYVDVTLECIGVEKTVRVNFEPVTLTVNGGANGSCKLVNEATFDVVLGNVYGGMTDTSCENIKVKSFTWGGTYYGGTFNTRSMSWSELQTYNIADLEQGVSSYVNITYADKKLTVKNTKSLVQSGYTHMVGSSQGALYSGYVKSDINMYVDIVLAVGGAEQTFRVNFISGVNGISLADGIITF